MAFSDKIKEAAQQAKERAAAAAQQHGGKVDDLLDKAGSAIDSRTGGKYSDKVGKAKDAVHHGVDKVAEQGRPATGFGAADAVENEIDERGTNPPGSEPTP